MKAIYWLVAVGFLGLGLLGVLKAGGESGLQVQCNLSGRLDEVENRELILLFSADMLPLGGQRDPAAVVRISPAIKGDFTWRGTRTLAFRPAARWAYSTRYSVTVPAGVAAMDKSALEQAQRWRFVTPPPLPLTAGPTRAKEYEWREVVENEALPVPIWVADDLLLHFNQAVEAATLQEFLQVREEASARAVPFTVAAFDADTLRLSFPGGLAREARFGLTLGKGFHGTEGTTGLEKNWRFYLLSMPRFRAEARVHGVLTPDVDRLTISFNNPLRRVAARAVSLAVVGSERRLKTRLGPVDPGDGWVYLELADGEKLRAGDTLRLTVGAGALNVWGEELAKPLEQLLPVCSSLQPELGAEFGDNRLTVAWKSIEKASLRLYRLNDSFLERTADGSPGVLQAPAFASSWLAGEVVRELAPQNDGAGERSFRLIDELGAQSGFFAVRVERARPFNVCGLPGLFAWPLHRDDELRVVHLRRGDFLLRQAPGQQLLWLYDKASGGALTNVPLQLRRAGQAPRALGASGGDGLLRADGALQPGDLLLADDAIRQDKAFYRLGSDDIPVAPVVTRLQLFSERGFYKPGETVHLAGIVREYVAGALRTPAGRRATVVVRGPDWREAARAEVTLDDRGGFAWDFVSKGDGPRGRYRFRLEYNGGAEECQATIDYYQANTFEVTVANVAPRLLRRDSFRADVSGAYLAGNPMAGDQLGWGLQAGDPVSASLVSSLPEAADYSFDLDEKLQLRDDPVSGAAKLSDDGALAVRVPMSRFAKTNYAAALSFRASAASAEGKEVSSSAAALFLPGERVCGLQLPFYNSSRQPLRVKLLLLDSAGRPVEGEVSVSLYKVVYKDYERVLVAGGVNRDVYVKERAAVDLAIPGPGDFVLKVDARDSAGNVVSTSAPFWAWSADFGPVGEELTVRAEKAAYKPGEPATLYITSSQSGRALVTVESHAIHQAKVIDLAKTTPFTFTVERAHFPAVNVVVSALFAGGASREARVSLQVLDDARKLQLQIAAPAEAKPAAQVEAAVQVRDAAGRGRKARLFVWAVDEGNLSLSAYGTPDPFSHFWRGADYLGASPVRSLWSRDCAQWTFSHPALDIPLAGAGIFGRVLLPDGAPNPGVALSLADAKGRSVATARTSTHGYFFFAAVPAGDYVLAGEAPGFMPGKGSVHHYSGERLTETGLVLLPVGTKTMTLGPAFGDEVPSADGAVGGVMAEAMAAPAPAAPPGMARMKSAMKGNDKEEAAADLAGITLRQNFREVLFFRQVETDENGRAAVRFETSDQLSAYRLMAVAYDGDCFGAAEQRLTVSKELLVAENMPEFARLNDRFRAGFQVSNRLARDLQVTAVVQAAGISLQGPGEQRFTLGGRKNQALLFDFLADKLGEAQLKLYAVSSADKDGLLQKLAVSDNLVTETLLDFDSGRDLSKEVQPQTGAEQQLLRLRLAPSILRPAVKIAEKLIFYPYECLEQRTSKVMPFLALDDALLAQLELKLDKEQIHAAVQEYLKIVPEFMSPSGGLCYYRGSPWASDYLSAYVLWAMELARSRGYTVDEGVMERAAGYLRGQTLSPEAEAFFQFVQSGRRQGDKQKLDALFAAKEKLSLTARAFLLRALHRQGGMKERERELAASFLTHLQVEADFAYFDASASTYWRDLPFLSSRYLTAIVLDTLLETGPDFPLAARVINWLLETGPEQWSTTQTNFWILKAMSAYAGIYERNPATKARTEVLGEKKEKNFSGPRDTFVVEKSLDGVKANVPVRASGDGTLYLTTELSYKLRNPAAKSRGIRVERNVYGADGKLTAAFIRGQTYQVELLLSADKEVPYGVIDEPLAAGFEILRQDVATTRELKEFNHGKAEGYGSGWLRQENAPDRVVFYSYALQGKLRVVYFVKALYSGVYTWLPTVVQGMYHPQYFGRGQTVWIEVKE